MAKDPGAAGDGPIVQGAVVPMLSEGLDIDEPVYIKESVRL